MKQILWIICLILIFDNAAISFSNKFINVIPRQENKDHVLPPYPILIGRGLGNLIKNEEVKQSLLQPIKDKRNIEALNDNQKRDNNITKFNMLQSQVQTKSDLVECSMQAKTLYSLEKTWWIKVLIFMHNLAVHTYGYLCGYLQSLSSETLSADYQ